MSLSVKIDWKRPTAVTGLALWWRADHFQGLVDGAAITSWPSAVGSSTATQGTGANQPTKQTVNGRACVRFDGSNDWLSLAGDALTVSQNKPGVSIFARAKVTPGAATKRLIYLSTGTSATAGRSTLYIDTTNVLATGSRRLDADSAQGIVGSNPGSTNIRVMTSILDYANSDGFLYLDGTLDASSTTFQTSGNTSNTVSLAAALGARGDGTAEFLGMDLYEVLVYPRAVTTDERTLVETYLLNEGLFNDVTLLTMRQQAPVSVEYGRDQSTALAPTISGRGSFTLNNRDKRFSPRNTASPLFGNLKPARPVRITRTVDGVTYVLFVGHTDDSPINPDPDSKAVSFSLVDSLSDFRAFNISTPLYAGVRTGEAIGYILDAFGWIGGRDLDIGATVMPYWWEDGADALTALETVIRCEGPPALLTIGSAGEIIFRDRHHRLIDTGSITSQGTWRSTGNEPLMQRPFVYDDAWRNIINTGTVEVAVRTRAPLDAVWTLDSPIGLTASETKTFIASTSEPFINAVPPVLNIDYTLISGSVTPSLSRTSGASTTITLVAGGGGAQLSSLQLRAEPVTVAHSVQVSASDSTSIADYGPRSFPGDLPFCNPHDAKAVLDTAVQQRAQPLTILQTRFVVAKNPTKVTAILSRDLSDRITVVEPETVVNGDFYVETIAHELTGEHDHAVTVGLEAIPPAGTVTAANVFIVGGGVGHQIGDGVLA